MERYISLYEYHDYDEYEEVKAPPKPKGTGGIYKIKIVVRKGKKVKVQKKVGGRIDPKRKQAARKMAITKRTAGAAKKMAAKKSTKKSLKKRKSFGLQK